MLPVSVRGAQLPVNTAFTVIQLAAFPASRLTFCWPMAAVSDAQLSALDVPALPLALNALLASTSVEVPVLSAETTVFPA